MRRAIEVFNLSIMGFGISVVIVDIIKQLFKTYKNPLAIVVSTESIGPNWYSGKFIKSILERLNAFMSFSPRVYLETWQIILVRWPWPWYP